MNSEQDACYRLDLAVNFLAEAEDDFARRRWRSCVDNSQLTVENAAKAIIACFRPVPHTHAHAHELGHALNDIVTTHPPPPKQVAEAITTVMVHTQNFCEREHIQASYGDEQTHRTPWEILQEPEATNAIQRARQSVSLARSVVEHFYPPSDESGQ